MRLADATPRLAVDSLDPAGLTIGRLMAFTPRVYVAAHYPWDVLAGLILDAGVTVLGWLILRVPLTELAAWLRRQPGVRSLSAPPKQREAAPKKVTTQP